MEIRRAGVADIPRIQAIAHAVWPVAYGEILSAAQLRYMLDLFYSAPALTGQMEARGHVFFIASGENGTESGFAAVSNSDGIAKLEKLYVMPGAQGTGTGRRLLACVEDEAIRLKAHAMELNVNRHNPARAFYERHGYRVLREEDIAIGEDYFMNDYRMGKSL